MNLFLASLKSSLLPYWEKEAQSFHFIVTCIAAFIKLCDSIWVKVVGLWAIIVYLTINFYLPGRISPDLYLYVYQPVLWLSLTMLAWLGWRHSLASHIRRPRPTRRLVLTAFLIGLCQIAVLAIAGLLLGFGLSPYNHQPDAILHNLLYLFTALLGMEMMRAYLAARFKRRHMWFSFILVACFITLLRFPPATFGQLGSLNATITLIGERLLPTLAQNMLATLLVLLGGPLPACIYLGALTLFEWLSPILPNAGWFALGFVGTIVPACGLVIVYNEFIAQPAEQGQSEAQKKNEFASWAVVAVLTLILVGFSTGSFGYHPSLIGSNSMTPKLLVGDIVIARDVPIEIIKVGDVITFQQEGVTIVHRVIEINNNAGQIIFITQGDANTSADPPVLASNYTGKMIFKIPKIGWISILVRNLMVKVL